MVSFAVYVLNEEFDNTYNMTPATDEDLEAEQRALGYIARSILLLELLSSLLWVGYKHSNRHPVLCLRPMVVRQ
eukprot:scaffold1365_cov121-Isochrysis_galbana.AAC.8